MRTVAILFMLSLISLSTGCPTSKGGMPADDAQAAAPTWSQYLSTAQPLPDGSFLVEGDLFFPNEQELRAHYERSVADGLISKAHVWTQLISGSPLETVVLKFPMNVAVDIQYCVAKADFDKVNTTYYARAVADMALAAAEWQGQANVRFKHVASLDATAQCTAGDPEPVAPVDFVVGPFNRVGVRGCADPSWLLWDQSIRTRVPACPYGTGAAGLPMRDAFDVLVLDYGAITAQAATGITGVGVARHELGHKLGLAHEHPWTPGGNPCTSENSGTANFLARPIHDGLPAYDPLSVMHYPGEYCSPPDPSYGPEIGYRLSMMDGYSVRAIYGTPVAWQIAAEIL